MKGVILHGGHGTRLRPLTHTGPKQLIPVANKPISQYVLEDLKNAGVKDVALIVGGVMPEKVKDYYSDGSKFGVNVKYVEQDKPLGIAHAVGLTEDFVGDNRFIVYLGDNLLKGGISDIAKEFEQQKFDAMVLLCKVEHPQQFGVAEFDKQGKLVRLVEKPKEPPSNFALTGIYFFTPLIFKMIKKLKPSRRGELEITEAIQLMLEEGYSVGYRIVDGWWKDTGTVEDILEANILVLDEMEPTVEAGVEGICLQGRVSVGKNAQIKKGAMIRGPTVIGENVIIESGVYIGPYTSVGNGTHVKKGEIENSIIMENCVIEIDTKIIDSIIGAQSEIATSQKGPKGHKLIVGESSRIVL
jgi:glucose-1-phosphate thymidylyltransferase